MMFPWILAAALHLGGVESPFAEALREAESALAAGRPEDAGPWLVRALERDPRSTAVWDLRARVAEAAGDHDLHVHSLHNLYRLSIAQDVGRTTLKALRARLESVDPFAKEVLTFRERSVKKLLPLAEKHRADRRWHSAIQVYQHVLALAPEHEGARVAIEEISSRPDPSLAETAKPKDLLADVSAEWIADFNAKHSTWDDRAELERDNYITYTDAGYEVLVRAAEAMEQMNAFYREFFQYGHEGDSRSIPRIRLHIFKERDEYLTLGIGPPVEWSGGHFTGSHVETYISGTFDSVVGTLFHEAAHQFVSLATTAQGWLNEGLASYFEGTQILANGTVIMNLPANHRLFPLATRMEKGWMADSQDGIQIGNPAGSTPEKAPRMQTIVENAYLWGPAWYAPTWGFVYFLWNYQDLVDGRFVYRDAFRDFINMSGGRRGPSAVENFEKVVLANPSKPTKGVDFGADAAATPRTAAELDDVWREWILALRDQQSGAVEAPERPWLAWARHAITRKEYGVAKEHFEKGIVAAPDDVTLLMEFGTLLTSKFKNADRASRLASDALRVLENVEVVDEKRVAAVEKQLVAWDPSRRSLSKLQEQMKASLRGLTTRYLEASLPTTCMDLSWRLGTDLGFPELFEQYEKGLRAGGHSLTLWGLAYNEVDLDGWGERTSTVWTPRGAELHSRFGAQAGLSHDFQFLLYDEITSGDFSLEAELYADGGRCSFAGLVFGKKSENSFHAMIYHPGRREDTRYGVAARQDFLDLTTFHGKGQFEIHRHSPLGAAEPDWHTMRIDVVGRNIDLWFDDQFVVTHTLPSLDLLRGGFGLMTGPGDVEWRDVRYLSRRPRDPASELERRERLRFLEEAMAAGEPVGGSYDGLVPPFPSGVGRWVQEPLTGWRSLRPGPTLLAFWNIELNERMPLDGWLRSLDEEFEAVGLQIVSVVPPDDDRRIDDYLKEHPVPGSLAVDKRPRIAQSYGDTLEAYLIPQFGMPRLLLLDVDRKVIWEGDPGFEFARPWVKGRHSYLRDPLMAVIKKRKLAAAQEWLARWLDEGEEALLEGDLSTAGPRLLELDDLPSSLSAPMEVASQRLVILRSAFEDLEGTADSLAALDMTGALPALRSWAEPLGIVWGRDEDKALRTVLKSDGVTGWEAACKHASKLARKLDADEPEESLADVEKEMARFGRMDGGMVRELVEALNDALARGSFEDVRQLLERPEGVASRWLVHDYFRWGPGVE